MMVDQIPLNVYKSIHLVVSDNEELNTRKGYDCIDKNKIRFKNLPYYCELPDEKLQFEVESIGNKRNIKIKNKFEKMKLFNSDPNSKCILKIKTDCSTIKNENNCTLYNKHCEWKDKECILNCVEFDENNCKSSTKCEWIDNKCYLKK
jgi:hypothetical protein